MVLCSILHDAFQSRRRCRKWLRAFFWKLVTSKDKRHKAHVVLAYIRVSCKVEFRTLSDIIRNPKLPTRFLTVTLYTYTVITLTVTLLRTNVEALLIRIGFWGTVYSK